MKKERFCAGCGKKIPWDHCALGTGDKTVCMGCERATVKAYKVRMGNVSYVDKDIEGVKAILESMEDDYEYTISRVEMRLTEYLSLPEFQGF